MFLALGGGRFAIDRRLLPAGSGACPLLAPLHSFHAFDFALLGGAFSLIGEPLSPVGDDLARIGFVITLIGQGVAPIGDPVALRGTLLSGAHLRFPHLEIDFARLHCSVLIVTAGARGALIPLGDIAAAPFVELDELRPAAFQRGAFALMRRRLPMQVGARCLACFFPESS